MDQFNQYLQLEREITESKLKIIESYLTDKQTLPEKRTSKIETIKNVLKMAGKPLHVSEIIEIALQEYDVHLERDSAVSAILKKVKAEKTFIRTAPNTFALKTDTAR